MNWKENKKKLIISSAVILLPILLGLLIWDQLPDVMATHWGVDSKPDGWTTKAFAVFGMPFLLLGMHWLCLWLTALDKRHTNQNAKATAMTFWIFPMVSLFSSALMYNIALGNNPNIASVVFIMLGLIFVLIGNYLPKTKMNYMLGIKVVWALRNEENWNATHRFGGKVWFMGGILMMLAGFFPAKFAAAVMLPLVLLVAFVPAFYSYCYYKKMCQEGRGYSLKMPETDKTVKSIYRVSTVIVVIILILVANIIFCGDITCSFHETGFTIETDRYDNLTVDYDTIESIELRHESIPGTRTFGFGSARLLLGVFENEEFGMYTRYTYVKSKAAIVIHASNKVLVLAAKTAEETEAIYTALLSKIG